MPGHYLQIILNNYQVELSVYQDKKTFCSFISYLRMIPDMISCKTEQRISKSFIEQNMINIQQMYQQPIYDNNILFSPDCCFFRSNLQDPVKTLVTSYIFSTHEGIVSIMDKQILVSSTCWQWTSPGLTIISTRSSFTTSHLSNM